MTETLRFGDVVKLHSGGPRMIIGAVDGVNAHCIWIGGEAVLPMAAIKRVKRFLAADAMETLAAAERIASATTALWSDTVMFARWAAVSL